MSEDARMKGIRDEIEARIAEGMDEIEVLNIAITDLACGDEDESEIAVLRLVALTDMGVASKDALSVLENAIYYESDVVRAESTRVLGRMCRMGIYDVTIVPSLIENLDNPVDAVREMSLWTIGTLVEVHAVTEDVLGPVADRLDDTSDLVKETAAWAIGILATKGIASKAVLKRMVPLLKVANRQVGGRTAAAIDAIINSGITSSKVLKQLITLLEDENKQVVVRALGNIASMADSGLARSEVFTRLLELTDDDSPVVRSEAMWALGNMVTVFMPVKGVQNAAFEMMRDEEECARVAALHTISRNAMSGMVSRRPLPLINQMMSEGSSLERLFAVTAIIDLAEHGVATKDSACPLYGLLYDEDEDVVEKANEAISVLTEMGVIDPSVFTDEG